MSVAEQRKYQGQSMSSYYFIDSWNRTTLSVMPKEVKTWKRSFSIELKFSWELCLISVSSANDYE